METTTSNFLGVTLKDVNEALESLTVLLNEKGPTVIKTKLFSRTQILTRIYDQNEYKENRGSYTMGDRKDVYQEETEYQEAIKAKVREYYTVLNIGGGGGNQEIEKYIQGFQKKFDTYNNFEQFKRDVVDNNFLDELLEIKGYNLIPKKGKDLQTFKAEMKALAINYFQSYNFVTNHSGYLVGLYKNNGEVTADKKHDQNLLSLSFIKKKDYQMVSEFDKSFLNMLVGEGVGVFSDAAVGLIAKTELAKKSIKRLNLLKSDMIKIYGELGKQYVSDQSYSRLETEIYNKKDEFSQELKNLCSNIEKNEGLSTEQRQILSGIEYLSVVIPFSNPVSLAISLIMGPGMALYSDWLSSQEGKAEINRFKQLVTKTKLTENIIADRPEEIVYKNETELKTIYADGTKINQIKAGRMDNEIRILGGDNNVVNAEGGDDIIYGYSKRDKIYGQDGNDTIIGGRGSDVLVGGMGSDTYIYNKGDGSDIIYSEMPIIYDPEMLYGNDTLVINGYKKSDIRGQIDGKKIKLFFGSPQTVMTTPENSSYSVDSITIGNTDRHDMGKDMNESISTITIGGNKIDVKEWLLYKNIGDIKGNDKENLIIGNGDNKQTITGNGGDDRIFGGKGNTTYKYQYGDGNDRIWDTGGFNTLDLSSVSLANVKFYQDGNNLEISINDKGKKSIITIMDQEMYGNTVVNKFIFMGRDSNHNRELSWQNVQKLMKNSLERKGVSFGEMSANMTMAYGAMSRIDPIIFDLDGDGIETVSVDKGTYFDLDNNGFSEKSGWISADDGFLVMDRNNNGMIDSGEELFGDQTILQDGAQSKNGYEALTELDQNKDGRIDENDEQFQSLKIWRDLNQDGYSSADELFDLKDYNIRAISTSNRRVNISDGHDNIKVRAGNYEKTDGTTGEIAEFLFARKTVESKPREILDLDGEIIVMPEIYGAGNVHSLRQSIARDETNRLKNLVTAFSKEQNTELRNNMIDEIIFLWAGTEKIDPGSRGGLFDARKLEVLEKFTGMEFEGSAGKNPRDNAIPILERTYSRFAEEVYVKLCAQTHLDEMLSAAYYRWEDDIPTEDLPREDLVGAISYIEQKLSENYQQGISIMKDFGRLLKNEATEERNIFLNYVERFSMKSPKYGELIVQAIMGAKTLASADDVFKGEEQENHIFSGNGNDNITGNVGGDCLFGQEGNDVLNGGAGNDFIHGGDGEDTIQGGDGNDILVGGLGNDILQGGKGRNRYLINRGDGNDRIQKEDYTIHNDTILFGQGIGQEEVQIKRVNDDMVVRVVGSDGQVDNEITVIDGFKSQYPFGSESGESHIDSIQFADGSSWDVNAILQRGKTVQGSGADDTLSGFRWNDIFCGSTGNDTYRIGRGEGDDIIVESTVIAENNLSFKENVNPADVLVKRVGEDLFLQILTNQESQDKRLPKQAEINSSVTVKGYYASSIPPIATITFEDGTTWNKTQIDEKAQYTYGHLGDDILKGHDWDDILYGSHGNDTFIGGKGNDIINAMAGSDTYVFDRGDGHDIIRGEIDYEGNPSTDTILFGEGIRPENVVVRREGMHRVFEVYSNDKKQIDNKITIEDDFKFVHPAIEKVQFADGSIWNKETIDQMARTIHGTDSSDDLHGFHSDDFLRGGKGNDTLNGAAGSDTYLFRRGDGVDTIIDNIDFEGNPSIDTILLEEDITADDVRVRRQGYDMVIEVYSKDKSTIDNQIFIKNEYAYPAPQIEQIKFQDGNIWSAALLKEKASTIHGTFAAETLSGSDGDDRIYGYEGNDTIQAGHGNDMIDGGKGNDVLSGGGGSDTYLFAKGDGQDIIREIDYMGSPSTDKAIFADNMLNLIFEKNGRNMKVSVGGSTDSVTIENWAFGKGYQVEEFHTADNRVLSSTKVDQLIEAMASFGKTGGMSWSTAIQQKPEEVNAILQNFWTTKVS